MIERRWSKASSSSWVQREVRQWKATWRSSGVSDERTKANGTEVDRATSFVQCWVVYKRGPKAGIERECSKMRYLTFLPRKRVTLRIFLYRS